MDYDYANVDYDYAYSEENTTDYDYADYSYDDTAISEFDDSYDDYADYSVYSGTSTKPKNFDDLKRAMEAKTEELFKEIGADRNLTPDAVENLVKMRLFEDLRRGSGAGRVVNNVLAHLNKHKLAYGLGGLGAAGLVGGGLYLANRGRKDDTVEEIPVV